MNKLTLFLSTLLSLAAASHVVAQDVKLLNVSYDPTRELHEDINDAFAEKYKAETGKTIQINQSHGGSAVQIKHVIDGLKADVVTPAVPQDVDALVKAGLVNPGWRDRLPNHSSPYTSAIIFLVRKGNPKGIKDWPDLIKPGVTCVAPNPKTGGGARYIFLAAWGSVLQNGGDDAKTKSFVGTLYRNIPVLDPGARAVTITFAQKKVSDCELCWENEAWLAQKEYADDHFEIVYPSVTVLGEPPVAVVDKVVDEDGNRAAAEAYLKFFYTPEAQDLIGSHHYRPRDPAALKKYEKDLPPLKLFTVEDVFGGWDKAQPRFFGDGGEFDQIYKK